MMLTRLLRSIRHYPLAARIVEILYGAFVLLSVPAVARQIDHDLFFLVALCIYLPGAALLSIAASAKINRHIGPVP